ncbi:1-acyl-sn-glycerol-3-phosphate acyltransferase [Microbacterium sp. SMR1]|uniref:1-acyl-sn-glycerol-3-phosphate acyltransferase n=1 Tax=Microbacterium sp. SMR1 TaxID=1497340 RepID=UPI000DCDFAAE|nr:1-acyl-sn-glycerol-3-phosphate acyltransferase [Microbacterium sp. SMR1]RAZ34782.1 acyl-phosphate glycerol 3-phosphate acyltransferase [Microbacterium sp. SMR1]
MLRRAIAHLFWTFSRWRLVSTPAPTRPTILIGAPHTSNWDFVLMLAIAWRLQIPVRWLGKKSLFRGWRSGPMRQLGGIPVDRDDPSRVVDDVLAQIAAGEVFGLVITPDGTRTSRTGWKSGFYRIARASGLPVTLGYVDRTTMTTGLGPTMELTGDVAADMAVIREFYADKAGFRPELRSEPRLRDENGGSAGDEAAEHTAGPA